VDEDRSEIESESESGNALGEYIAWLLRSLANNQLSEILQMLQSLIHNTTDAHL
jgi:hypothetical protein